MLKIPLPLIESIKNNKSIISFLYVKGSSLHLISLFYNQYDLMTSPLVAQNVICSPNTFCYQNDIFITIVPYDRAILCNIPHICFCGEAD